MTEPNHAPASAPASAPVSVLVVEDDPTTSLLVSTALTRQGYRIAGVATSGRRRPPP